MQFKKYKQKYSVNALFLNSFKKITTSVLFTSAQREWRISNADRCFKMITQKRKARGCQHSFCLILAKSKRKKKSIPLLRSGGGNKL